jgi:hypothetical protein
MVQPNASTIPFCGWALTSGFYRWSTARHNLITLVGEAAVNVTPVTNQQWNDFIRTTNIVWFAYLQASALTE